MKNKKDWQKNGIWCFLFLYTLLSIVFLVKREFSAWEDGSAAMMGNNIAVQTAQENDNYREIKKIALTFDDGPHPIYTEQILDGLKERGVKATFFITGSHAEKYPEIVKRIYEEGHIIGNHTYSHMQLKAGNRSVFVEELQETNHVIEEITGQETIYVRPPYGEWDKTLEKELNMFPVFWTIDPLDWCSKDASCVAKIVIDKADANDIILMHDEYETTKIAALEIIDRLREEGYDFVTVDEILFN